jgi:phosphatidylglycerophosphatase A
VSNFSIFSESSAREKLAIFLATWGFSGFLPKAPGTWGSLAALPAGALIQFYAGSTGLLIAAIVLFAVGIWCSNVYVSVYGKEDPGEVVIDEVVGVFITLAFVPFTLFWYLIAFALFRLFDILKPFPINLLDRHVKGGVGIMVDDVVAAGYAASIAFALFLLFTLVL